MKIDLDLSEIFSSSGEDVNESVKESIINTVSDKIYKLIERSVQSKVSNIVENEIKVKVKSELDALIPSLLDYEFIETSHYGVTSPKISVRNRILQDIENQCKWRDGSFDSDKSPYTKAVKKMVEEQLAKFKSEFVNAVDSKFVDEAYKYAELKIKEKLKIGNK